MTVFISACGSEIQGEKNMEVSKIENEVSVETDNTGLEVTVAADNIEEDMSSFASGIKAESGGDGADTESVSDAAGRRILSWGLFQSSTMSFWRLMGLIISGMR